MLSSEIYDSYTFRVIAECNIFLCNILAKELANGDTGLLREMTSSGGVKFDDVINAILKNAADIRTKYQILIAELNKQPVLEKENTMSLMNDLDKIMGFASREDMKPAYERLKAHIEATTPWYPPVPEGYGEWIEYKRGDMGPPVNMHIYVLDKKHQNQKLVPQIKGYASEFYWRADEGSTIVAYCIKKPETNQ
jgi:hypothetical protein